MLSKIPVVAVDSGAHKEIIKNSFDTIADDMAITLMRTAYSGIVRDSLDFS